jgi:hypothetical protein
MRQPKVDSCVEIVVEMTVVFNTNPYKDVLRDREQPRAREDHNCILRLKKLSLIMNQLARVNEGRWGERQSEQMLYASFVTPSQGPSPNPTRV